MHMMRNSVSRNRTMFYSWLCKFDATFTLPWPTESHVGRWRSARYNCENIWYTTNWNGFFTPQTRMDWSVLQMKFCLQKGPRISSSKVSCYTYIISAHCSTVGSEQISVSRTHSWEVYEELLGYMINMMLGRFRSIDLQESCPLLFSHVSCIYLIVVPQIVVSRSTYPNIPFGMQWLFQSQ